MTALRLAAVKGFPLLDTTLDGPLQRESLTSSILDKIKYLYLAQQTIRAAIIEKIRACEEIIIYLYKSCSCVNYPSYETSYRRRTRRTVGTES